MDQNASAADDEGALGALDDEAQVSLRAAMRDVHPETGNPTPEATYSVRRAEVLAILHLASAFRGHAD
jgi:hypothetical protein